MMEYKQDLRQSISTQYDFSNNISQNENKNTLKLFKIYCIYKILFLCIMRSQNQNKIQRWQIIKSNQDSQSDRSISIKNSSHKGPFTPKKKSFMSPPSQLFLNILNNKQANTSEIKEGSKQNQIVTKHREKYLIEILPSSQRLNPRNANSMIDTSSKMQQMESQLTERESNKKETEGVRKSRIGRAKEQKGDQRVLEKDKVNQLNYKILLLKNKIKKQSDFDIHYLNELNIEQLLRNCIKIFEKLEVEIADERLEILKMLDEKQNYLKRIKESILSKFHVKQNLITNRDLRQQLRQEISFDQPKQLLSRITSEKLFNRKLFEDQNYSIERNQRSRQGQLSREKSVNLNSVRSYTSTTYRKNFDQLFKAINKMKQQLASKQGYDFNGYDGHRNTEQLIINQKRYQNCDKNVGVRNDGFNCIEPNRKYSYRKN